MSGTILQIKRTTGTGVPSGGAERGELVYVYDTSDTSSGSQGQNTKRLFIGDGPNQSLIKVGGEYYTNLLEVPLGTLTAKKALIADDNKAIDDLYIGNSNTTGGSIKFNEGLSQGSNYVALKAPNDITSSGSSFTLTLPSAKASINGQALVGDTSGNLSFATIASTLDITDGSTSDVMDLTADDLKFTGIGAITTSLDTSVSNVTEIEISVTDATLDNAATVVKGVASYDNADFTISSGNVSLSQTPSAFTSITVGDVSISGTTVTSTSGNSLSITTDTGDLTLNPATDIDANNNKIKNLATPTNANDAVTKAYVDAVKTGLDIKDSVVAATTADLSASYSNGVLTAGSNGAISIDGISLSLNDRVLVKDQTTGSENGLYTVTTVGDGSNPFVLTRSTDADNSPSGEVTSGLFTFVEQGSLYADTGWVLTTDGTITLGTTSLAFTQFSGAGHINAGTGLTLSGNTINVGGSTTIIANADDIEVNSSATQYQVLVSGGTAGTAATFGALSLDQSAAVSGILSVANGGTGISTTPQGSVLISNTLDTFSALDGGSTIIAANDVGVLIYSQATDTVSWSNTIDGGTY